MSEVHNWNTSAALNNSTPPDGAPENTMTLGQVNDTMREIMRATKAWQADTDGSITSTNTGNAYSVSIARTTALYNGMNVRFTANAANSGAVTLNVSGTGAIAVKYLDGTDVRSAEWQPNRLISVVYVSALGVWVTTNPRHPILTTRGDLLTRSAADEVRLPIGTANYVLKSDGLSPSWAPINGSLLNFVGVSEGDILVYRASGGWQTMSLGTNQIFKNNGSTLAAADAPGAVDLGSKTLSGSSVEWTNIPSDVRVIYVLVDQASKNANSDTFLLQFGTSSAYQTVGYTGYTTWNGVASEAWSSGAQLIGAAFASTRAADLSITIALVGSNVWSVSISGAAYSSGTATAIINGCGRAPLSAALTRIKFLTSGSDTFDAGTARAWGIR